MNRVQGVSWGSAEQQKVMDEILTNCGKMYADAVLCCI